MGAFLDKPKTEKYSDHGWGNRNELTYSVSSMQGWRIEMEDAHCIRTSLPGLEDWSFFAVFDGHAGARVSVHCAENLVDTILESEEFQNYTVQSSDTEANQQQKQIALEDVERLKKGIREGFLRLDERMREIPEVASGADKSGSTAVCVFVSPTHFYFANCGDSRAVLSRGGRAFFVTEDHKPVNPAEKERIQKAGGSVMIQRVNGSLAVSRALGDYEYKQVEGKGPCEQLVSPEPEVSVLERDDARDEFLLLACDGVWDVMTNDEICDNVRRLLQADVHREAICNSIIDACLCKGSKDNMSVVLVCLPAEPDVQESVVKEDAEVNQVLKSRLKDIVQDSEKIEMSEIIRILAEDDTVRNSLQHLPLGSLFFKYSYLEEVCKGLQSEWESQNSVQDVAAVSQN